MLDVVLNNADRKGGHVLEGLDGGVYGIDHGICLHTDDKLRTVLWGGRVSRSAHLLADIASLADDLGPDGPVRAALAGLITDREIGAVATRCAELVDTGAMPYPPGRRPIPWPRSDTKSVVAASVSPYARQMSNSASRFPDCVPVLSDGVVTLRAHRADDIDRVTTGRPPIPRWPGGPRFPVPYECADAEEFVLQHIPAKWNSGTAMCWVIDVDGLFAGGVDIRGDGPEPRSVTVCTRTSGAGES